MEGVDGSKGEKISWEMRRDRIEIGSRSFSPVVKQIRSSFWTELELMSTG